MTRRNPMVYVFHMVDYSHDAINMAQGHSRADMDNNTMLRLALIKAVETIGEASSRVTEDLRSRYPDLPWRETRDLRNRLVHDVRQCNLDVTLCGTLSTDDIPTVA